jgi:hypothetical protein
MRNTATILLLGAALVTVAGACGNSVTQTTSSNTGGSRSSSEGVGGKTTDAASGTGGIGTSATAGTGGVMTDATTGVGAGPGVGGASMTSSTGGMATSTTSTSGSMTTSSSGGTGGTGPAGCPLQAPANLSACTVAGEYCSYGANECTCGPGGMMMGDVWRCHMCPATQPMQGASCTGMGNAGTSCTYGTTDCTCAGGMWSCGTCPAMEPTNGSMCPANGIHCDFPDATCTCGAAAGPGMGMPTWHCNAPCPAMQPSAGTPCSTAAMMQCMYGMTTCLCLGGQFFCN